MLRSSRGIGSHCFEVGAYDRRDPGLASVTSELIRRATAAATTFAYAYQNAFPLLRAIPGGGARRHLSGSLPPAPGCGLPIESESSAGSAVTGLGLRERLAAPVAETPDVTFGCSRSFRSRPNEPLSRNHRQNHRRAGSWPGAMGPALGNGGGEGAARHAAERVDPSQVFRNQCADPLGRRHRTRLLQPELADLPPGARPRRQCQEG